MTVTTRAPVTIAASRGLLSPWASVRQRPELLTVPLVFLLLMDAWEAAVRHWQIEAFILPGPIAIARELAEGIAAGYFTSHTFYGAFFVKGVPQGSYPFSRPSVSLFDLEDVSSSRPTIE
jgi:hypothetical protein